MMAVLPVEKEQRANCDLDATIPNTGVAVFDASIGPLPIKIDTSITHVRGPITAARRFSDMVIR